MYLRVTAAAESCRACLTRRALQGQYILSAPNCQLSPSQLRCWVALQNLQSPASPVQCISHHPSSRIPALPRRTRPYFPCLPLAAFLTSLPPPLFSAFVFLCVLFYCDINLGNFKLRAKLPCPAGRPGIRPGLAGRRQVGRRWGAAHPSGCWPPPCRAPAPWGAPPFNR